jgi:5'-methylthioadenosine phosphorylase
MIPLRIGVIGGSGVRALPFDKEPEPVSTETRWGVAHGTIGILGGREVVFLARHGAGHSVPPHKINYRANIAGLKQLGCQAVLATTAVGSLRADLLPGTLCVLDQLIDYTLTRPHKTFFDGENGSPVVHTDVTYPFAPLTRQAVLQAAEACRISVRDGGTYLCFDGPRYETAAEVRLFASWGADVVGMTAIPEATLAREAGLHYAGISLVTNLGAGISQTPLNHTEVEEAMAQARPRLTALLSEAIQKLPQNLPSIGPEAGVLYL